MKNEIMILYAFNLF